MDNNYQNKRHPKVREFISKVVLFIVDLSIIFTVLFLAFFIHSFIYEDTLRLNEILNSCIKLFPTYIIISCIFFYEGIYTRRFDFWQESGKILKGLFLAFITVISFSVIINQSQNYPIDIIFYSFTMLSCIIPLSKYFLKLKLFKLGYWKKGVKVLSKNAHLEGEIFGNPYLGYIKSKRKEADLVFVDSYKKHPDDLKNILEKEIQSKDSVLFVPVFNNYQFSNSDVYDLTNTRTNLIVLENKLKSKYRMFINITYNISLAIIMIPLIMPIVGLIALLISQDSKGPIFFRQKRLGKDGKEFMVFKFRTMYTEDMQEKLLKDYLEENPHEIKNYEVYCKYDNDPRVTRVGNLLRKNIIR